MPYFYFSYCIYLCLDYWLSFVMTRTIVHFLDSDTFGGCEEVVLQLLAGLDKNKWLPVLFHHDKPGISRLIDEANKLGISSRVVPEITGDNALQTIPKFFRILKDVKPTIFHAHLNWPLGCRYGLGVAWLNRVPAIVATAHLYSPIKGVRLSILKQYFQSVAIGRYIAVSNEVSERFCQSLSVPASKIKVVHNGIRLEPFNQPADLSLRESLTEGQDCPIVFTPARLHSQKGHKHLLDAAAMLPEAIFVLAGDGPERNDLEKRTRELGIEMRVRFLGNRQDVPKLLATCDLFVLPSLYEGLPISVLEAMAAGKPIVATDIGGTKEAIINQETGLLVPPGSAQELAGAIKRMLSDPKLASRLGAAGKERAKRMFSSDVMAREVGLVYEGLLQATTFGSHV